MSLQLVGFLCCYNEIDIVENTLQYYQRLGVPIVFVDNGSTDGTSEVAQRYQSDVVLEYIYHPTDEYDLRGMLDFALSAVARYNPQWIMHIDADHLYEPGEGFATLWSHADDAREQGCNVIDFDEYVFLPTDRDDPAIPHIYDRVKHYAFRPGKVVSEHTAASALLQPRLYRYVPGMRISENGGHSISYPEEQMVIHPAHGILRHYMFRSPEQGRRKLRERRSRYSRAGRARGWHTQYDSWREDDAVFRRSATELCTRVEGGPWRHDVTMQSDGRIHRVQDGARLDEIESVLNTSVGELR